MKDGPPKKRRLGIGKTAGIMLGLGIALGWACVFLIPGAQRLGVPAATANKLPFVGLAIGLSWGVGIAASENARAAVGYLVAPVLGGAVFWFFGVFLGGLLVGIGFPPGAADYVPLLGFAAGAALGSAPLVARGVEVLYRRRGG